MSLHRGRFVVVLALSLVVVFSGCHKPGMAGHSQSCLPLLTATVFRMALLAWSRSIRPAPALRARARARPLRYSFQPIAHLHLQLPDRYRIAVYRDCECGYTRWH